MIDPSQIDERYEAARQRDDAVFAKLKDECARLIVVDQYQSGTRVFSLDALTSMIKPARFIESGNSSYNSPTYPAPENGSFANQLFSAIAFAIDARAELKLLELIRQPDFYVSAMMRSAAEVPK
jgi:hypothetical protein